MSDTMSDTTQQMLVSLTRLQFPHLSTIIEVFRVLRTLDRQMLDEVQRMALQVSEFVVNIQCKLFILTADRITSASVTVGQMFKQTAKIPAELQPKVREMRNYIEKAKEEIDEFLAVLSEVAAKIKEASEKEFKVTSTEMYHLQRGKDLLDFKLRECREYLNAVERVKDILMSDGRVKTVELGAGVAATATGVVLLVAKVTATVAGVVQGSLGVFMGYVCYKIGRALFDYSDVLCVKRAEIESEVRTVEMELDHRQRYVDGLLSEDFGQLEVLE